MVKVEVEVETLAQLDEALAAGAEAVLLDNMDLPTLREAVRRARGRAMTEASGGVHPENVREMAETDVDLVSPAGSSTARPRSTWRSTDPDRS
jgi:nicotinate-nucleotide pyrophosphorylase (carboxylating)